MVADVNDRLWSDRASQHFLLEPADVLLMANSGHRRMNMEMPETALTSPSVRSGTLGALSGQSER